ncbi:MAG: gephyrin-like molybdotransferase Glp [Chloroflexota bacterium]
MADLLNVDEAIARIVGDIVQLETETVHLTDTLNRVLAEDIVSEIDLPPFDNSAMDGFAVRAVDLSGAGAESPVRLDVVMDIPAGYTPEGTLGAGQAARIMTGAPMPDGADAVIPVEDTDADFSDLDNSTVPEVVQLYKAVGTGAAVRKLGENIHAGQTILKAGTVIRAAQIGLLASLGQVDVPVVRQPRVSIVGSGDELVDIDAPLTPGTIRDSNSYALAALVAQDGGVPLRQPIAKDTPDAIRAMFKDALDASPDLIVSSAGVSVGAADYVRDILDEIGDIGFWRINLRPGKPLAYGSLEDVPFFGLPGNPVSAMVTYMVLVRPALLKLAGRSAEGSEVMAKVGEPMHSDGRRTFARVTLAKDGDDWVATTTGTQSSGAHLSMALADGLLVIPEGNAEIPVGTRLPVKLLRPIG